MSGVGGLRGLVERPRAVGDGDRAGRGEVERGRDERGRGEVSRGRGDVERGRGGSKPSFSAASRASADLVLLLGVLRRELLGVTSPDDVGVALGDRKSSRSDCHRDTAGRGVSNDGEDPPRTRGGVGAELGGFRKDLERGARGGRPDSGVTSALLVASGATRSSVSTSLGTVCLQVEEP
mmetsp:Transcript_69499/g.163334  ORF Transcript_69499/g.163334 Transcript_69499/m.163334 type:complete len:179 (+) Transcript_69499:317-853(+)